MQQRKAPAAVALLGLGLVPASALASAPASVWVKVQEIVYAPNATSPTHVQVRGALMLFDGVSCRLEWSDLEANIAKPEDQCVGFGVDSLPTGTLHQPSSAVANPDIYPIQIGVSAGFSPCQAIAQFLAANQGGAGGEGGSGGASSSAGTGSSTGGAGMGGKPETSGDLGAGAGGKAPASGSAGSTTSGSGKGGTAAGGRAGSGSGNLDPDPSAKDGPADSKAAGCSVAAAAGAASVLGLGGAVGLIGLALARRQRSSK